MGKSTLLLSFFQIFCRGFLYFLLTYALKYFKMFY